MASHRKPRPAGYARSRHPDPRPRHGGPHLRGPALPDGATPPPADAEGRASKRSKKKVDDLYHQAETATEKYNAAKEKTGEAAQAVDTLLDDVARRTDKLNDAREELGSFAAAQYRTGAVRARTATLLLADDPQDYFDQTQLMGRLTTPAEGARSTSTSPSRPATTEKRAEATESLQALTDVAERRCKTSKATVQKKLAEARDLLSKLTAEEKARLAAIEKKKREAGEAQGGGAGAAAGRRRSSRPEEAAAQQQTGLLDRPTATRPALRRATSGSTRHGRLVHHQGRQGARVRPRPDRQAVRLGRHRPGLLRLLGAHPGRLEGRRRRPARAPPTTR